MAIQLARYSFLCVLTIWPATVSAEATKPQVSPPGITLDYPENATLFPPEFPAPTFIWRDSNQASSFWVIEVKFGDGSRGLKIRSEGEKLRVGEIDQRCVAPTNQLPSLTEQQAAAHAWVPDTETWATIKKHTVSHPATLIITGFADKRAREALSRGQASFQTSKDPVGAPIFYRDVPLMPAATEKGIIRPLVPAAIPLIAWRLRDVSQPESRLLMEGLHTCANCHSASTDGKTLAMDVDGPDNDKGLYAIFPIRSHTSIRNEDVVAWSSHEGKLGGKLRVGFMSQLSPDGQYVVTTINDPGTPQTPAQRRKNPQDIMGNYYVANFMNYRFLQVFYPTRGVLAWYSRETGRLQPLPGADDPRYVHANAVWSPDGKYLVFLRAEAREAYPVGSKLAEYPNDPNETAIQYDLYRIPFNGGKGGVAEAIAGASGNGMSNTFPKLSPDGRWIVFTQCRNGLLMRPDSRLFIVPAEGGQARLMRCNTPLMNSWHSFSPNGRWLVFSSKSRSPYTQMFLTHVDENGNDTPAILIENTTAANRAVNIPEFLNITPDQIATMDAPATEFYRVFDLAAELRKKGDYDAAISEWRRALQMSPNDVRVYHNLGVALAAKGSFSEAIDQYQKALAVDPEYSDSYVGWGFALSRSGRVDEAIPKLAKALELNPKDASAMSNLGAAMLETGRIDQAVWYSEKALEINASDPEARGNLAVALAMSGRPTEAIPHFEQALAASPDSPGLHYNLGFALLETNQAEKAIAHLEKALTADPTSADLHYHLANAYAASGQRAQALETARKGLGLALQQNNQELATAIRTRIAALEATP
ncbi:MAG: tetratricopeptide repeat protein [Acidobacteria bacterium]|nr:MAG: tetratricopeptide repeat protein [Acidobacteriota bacterium]